MITDCYSQYINLTSGCRFGQVLKHISDGSDSQCKNAQKYPNQKLLIIFNKQTRKEIFSSKVQDRRIITLPQTSYMACKISTVVGMTNQTI